VYHMGSSALPTKNIIDNPVILVKYFLQIQLTRQIAINMASQQNPKRYLLKI
jgi:hypothetical protein